MRSHVSVVSLLAVVLLAAAVVVLHLRTSDRIAALESRVAALGNGVQPPTRLNPRPPAENDPAPTPILHEPPPEVRRAAIDTMELLKDEAEVWAEALSRTLKLDTRQHSAFINEVERALREMRQLYGAFVSGDLEPAETKRQFWALVNQSDAKLKAILPAAGHAEVKRRFRTWIQGRKWLVDVVGPPPG